MTGLANGDRYVFRLQAMNDSGVSHQVTAYATPSVMPPATVGVRWSEDDYAATEGGRNAVLVLRPDSLLDQDVTIPLWRVYEGTTSPADIVFPDPPQHHHPGRRGVRVAHHQRGPTTTSRSPRSRSRSGSPSCRKASASRARPRVPLPGVEVTDNDATLEARFEQPRYEVREGGSVDVTPAPGQDQPRRSGDVEPVAHGYSGVERRPDRHPVAGDLPASRHPADLYPGKPPTMPSTTTASRSASI